MKLPAYGFKLFQPWANEVVSGNLNYLIRSMNTKKRGLVAVIATKNVDKSWLKQTNKPDIINTNFRIGAIGEVILKDVISCRIEDVKGILIENAGKDYWENYPKHLIPSYTITKKIYIWILNNARKWDTNIEIKTGGMVWAKLNNENTEL